jgi:hypothetical protein
MSITPPSSAGKAEAPEKQKARSASVAPAGLDFLLVLWLSVISRQHAHRMVMMVVMGQRSHFTEMLGHPTYACQFLSGTYRTSRAI